MKVSFKGCNNQVVTFMADEKIRVGTPVKISGNCKVAPAGAGDTFVGCVVNSDGSYAAVCISGVVDIPCNDSGIKAGWCDVACDGNGGIKQGENGFCRFVISVNTADKTATIIL